MSIHNLVFTNLGLAKKYKDRRGHHIPFRDDKSLTGTARYASINTHRGHEQGRRDDIEGMVYVCLYLAKGSLPWQGLAAADKVKKYTRIVQKKISTTPEQLCGPFALEFLTILKYARSLKFEERPDYDYVAALIHGALGNLNAPASVRLNDDSGAQKSSKQQSLARSSSEERKAAEDYGRMEVRVAGAASVSSKKKGGGIGHLIPGAFYAPNRKTDLGLSTVVLQASQGPTAAMESESEDNNVDKETHEKSLTNLPLHHDGPAPWPSAVSALDKDRRIDFQNVLVSHQALAGRQSSRRGEAVKNSINFHEIGSSNGVAIRQEKKVVRNDKDCIRSGTYNSKLCTAAQQSQDKDKKRMRSTITNTSDCLPPAPPEYFECGEVLQIEQQNAVRPRSRAELKIEPQSDNDTTATDSRGVSNVGAVRRSAPHAAPHATSTRKFPDVSLSLSKRQVCSFTADPEKRLQPRGDLPRCAEGCTKKADGGEHYLEGCQKPPRCTTSSADPAKSLSDDLTGKEQGRVNNVKPQLAKTMGSVVDIPASCLLSAREPALAATLPPLNLESRYQRAIYDGQNIESLFFASSMAANNRQRSGSGPKLRLDSVRHDDTPKSRMAEILTVGRATMPKEHRTTDYARLPSTTAARYNGYRLRSTEIGQCPMTIIRNSGVKNMTSNDRTSTCLPSRVNDVGPGASSGSRAEHINFAPDRWTDFFRQSLPRSANRKSARAPTGASSKTGDRVDTSRPQGTRLPNATNGSREATDVLDNPGTVNRPLSSGAGRLGNRQDDPMRKIHGIAAKEGSPGNKHNASQEGRPQDSAAGAIMPMNKMGDQLEKRSLLSSPKHPQCGMLKTNAPTSSSLKLQKLARL